MTTAESNGSTVVPEISVWFGSEYTVMKDKRGRGEACGYYGIQSFGSHVAGVDVCKQIVSCENVLLVGVRIYIILKYKICVSSDQRMYSARAD